MNTTVKARHSLAPRRIGRASAIILVAMAPVAAFAAPPVAKVVQSAADLPRYSYVADGRLADLLTDDTKFAALAMKARVDIEATLAGYRIEDRATVRDLHRSLLNLAMLRGDTVVARREIAVLNSLQDKEADKLTVGLREAVYLDALAAGPAGSAAFKSSFQKNYAAALEPLPWAVVGSKLQETAGMAPVMTPGYLSGIVDTQFQPAVSAGKVIDGEIAARMISLAAQYRLFAPLTAETVAAINGYIASHAVQKRDIWAARAIVLPTSMKLSPVTIAVWDDGVDTGQFEGRLWINPAEAVDGKDDDHNGYIDDVNGIAYNQDSEKEVALLTSVPAEFAPRLDATRLLMQGMMDQQAGIDSADAKHVRDIAATASPDIIKRTFEDAEFYNGAYAHGTHVAGIIADGNPALRLLVVRTTFDWRSPPPRPTQALAVKSAQASIDIVNYLKWAGVRVVNMSWLSSFKGYEEALAANGVPANQVQEEARRLFAIDSKGLRDAIASAPDILFICAAGNENDSASFSGTLPASIDAPNVITVAAVDQAGDPTGFTSGGPSVDIAASGYQVDSVVPGGTHQRWSGTSMASPAVVNAAAKLLAVNPKLSVAQLRSLLLETATAGSGGLRLLDAQAALKRLQGS